MQKDRKASKERPIWLDPRVILVAAVLVWGFLTACSTWAEFGTDRAREIDPTKGLIVAPRGTDVPTVHPNSWAAQLTKTATAQQK